MRASGCNGLRVLALVSTLALAACGSSPPPPAMLDLTVQGSAEQNPSPSGTAEPVAVHLYQLASTAKFERADVFALVEREAATLGQDVLASEELVLSPSEKQSIKRELKKGTQSLGVVVLFRDIDHAKWRATAPVAASGPSKLALTIGRLSVDLGPSK
ncbi:MAG TPA: type VI secretion system lipoprotein TssJ [Acetobacteraceae bacterium]|nr:type VI secretion system lipoprotein TssJ [Acetobacteraceae bacterium]